MTAAEGLISHIIDDTLVQSAWHSTDAQGRETACMLGAMHADINSPADCKASVMPGWMARAIPNAFDRLPASEVKETSLRFAEFMLRFDGLPWDRIFLEVTAQYAGRLYGAEQHRNLITFVIETALNAGAGETTRTATETYINATLNLPAVDDLRYALIYGILYSERDSLSDRVNFFPDLFAVLAIHLPAPTEDTIFDFTATFAPPPPALVIRPLRIAAPNIVRARVLAKEFAIPGSVIRLTPPAPLVQVPAFIIEARDHVGLMHWHGANINGALNWVPVSKWLREQPRTQGRVFHNTESMQEALKTNYADAVADPATIPVKVPAFIIEARDHSGSFLFHGDPKMIPGTLNWKAVSNWLKAQTPSPEELFSVTSNSTSIQAHLKEVYPTATALALAA